MQISSLLFFSFFFFPRGPGSELYPGPEWSGRVQDGEAAGLFLRA